MDDLKEARRRFQSRLLETRGVVASDKDDNVACSIQVRALHFALSSVTEKHFDTLRRLWETPCGKAFAEATEFRAHARELGLGFSYTWVDRDKIKEWEGLVEESHQEHVPAFIEKVPLGLTPAQLAFLEQNRAPTEWLNARREWCCFVREQISRGQKFDTMLQVANACDAGLLPIVLLKTWREIEPTYKPLTRAVFHDTSALEVCVAWMKKERGIVWVEHRAAGEALSRLTGAPYYGAGGLDTVGNSVVDAKGNKSIICSIAAIGQGFNLQMFSKALITSCPSGAATVEQVLGRIHRDGQEADEVVVDVLLGCAEHAEAFERALDGARAAEDILGHSQKLCLADIVFQRPNKKGPLWA